MVKRTKEIVNKTYS